MEKVLQNFRFTGDFVDIKPYGSGHINETYIATYNDGGLIKHYIIQKINTEVFKNIDELMENVFAVTSHIRNKVESDGGDKSRETLHFIKTVDSKKYLELDGGCYRAYRFVDDSVCYNSAATAEMFGKSGEAFGKFQKYLKDFPADTLNETISNFHNTIWRYENEFLPSIENDVGARSVCCLKEIEFIKARKGEMSILTDMISQGKLPLRVTHNDTKLNNVLFDKNTGNTLCVIDLDTVMPGLALYDFGDSIRFGASTAAEDEQDLQKVSVDLDYFEAYAKGFLKQAGDGLTQAEIDNLAFSAKLMTLECGMRFLSDFLNGDIYFKKDYSIHNLIRAKNQLKLVSDMEAKMDKMKEIIKNSTK